MAELWGGETRKAVDNFPVSGETIPVAVVHWLGRIKGAAARVNASLGLLDEGVAERIAAAADEIAAGEHDDQFPIDVFQTGSGTSSNMNANEVIATLAGEGVHANDHVNLGQSSNDVFPSAVHLAALDRTTHELLPAVAQLGDSLARKAERVRGRGQGRAHAPDGRRSGHPRPGVRRLRGAGARGACADRGDAGAAGQDPAGRHRGRHRPEHASPVRGGGARPAVGRHRPRDPAAGRPVRGAGQPRWAGRGVGGAEGSRRVADEDRERPALDGLGTAGGAGRDLHPGAAEGQLDHARQGQPGDPRGGVPGVGAGDRQRHGDHRGRTAGQLRAERADPADGAQPAPVDRAAQLDVPAVRGEVRGRDRGQPRGLRAPRRGHRWRWRRRSIPTSATTAPRRS